jgi:hypothetical protein
MSNLPSLCFTVLDTPPENLDVAIPQLFTKWQRCHKIAHLLQNQRKK